MSAGWPARFIGTCFPKFLTASSGIVDGINGVKSAQGDSVYTDTFFSK
jgi:hypothetical protein